MHTSHFSIIIVAFTGTADLIEAPITKPTSNSTIANVLVRLGFGASGIGIIGVVISIKFPLLIIGVG